MPDDSEDSAVRAMPLQTTPAPITFSTGEIDFSDYALSDPSSRLCLYDVRDKFVSRASAKPTVSALQFQISVTDSTQSQSQ